MVSFGAENLYRIVFISTVKLLQIVFAIFLEAWAHH